MYIILIYPYIYLCRQNLTDSSDALTQLDTQLDNATKAVEVANNRLMNIRKGVDQLKTAAEQLKANATKIRELDVSGEFPVVFTIIN
jgi:uncharacterized phage infection (PIP) family protein YhgE